MLNSSSSFLLLNTPLCLLQLLQWILILQHRNNDIIPHVTSFSTNKNHVYRRRTCSSPFGVTQQEQYSAVHAHSSSGKDQEKEDCNGYTNNDSLLFFSEDEIRDIAATALIPVLSFVVDTTTNNENNNNNNNNSSSCSSSNIKNTSSEKALKRCLRTYKTTIDNKQRKRLSELILGTSVMRLRHAYLLGEGHSNESLLLTTINSINNNTNTSTSTNTNINNSAEEKGNDDNNNNSLRIIRALVDLQAEYLKEKDTSSSNNSSKESLLSNNRVGRKWPSNPVKYLSVKQSLPAFFVKFLIDQYGFEESNEIARVSNKRGPITIRRNRLLEVTEHNTDDNGKDIALCERLKEEGVDAVPIETGPPGCISIRSLNQTSIWSLQAWKDGLFEVQDKGSQLIIEATEANADTDHIIVDYCAGNGGKTLGMASRAAMAADSNNDHDNQSCCCTIIAHDIVEMRLRQINGSLRRAGLLVAPTINYTINIINNIETTASNNTTTKNANNASNTMLLSASASKSHPCVVVETTSQAQLLPSEIADLVLVDAPCSSSGVLRRRPSHRWTLTPTMIQEEFPSLQLSILKEAARLVKPGGKLVYATCSIFEQENEKVAAAFELENIDKEEEEWERWLFDSSNSSSSSNNSSSVIWNDDRVSTQSSNGGNWRAILPHKQTDSDGFFIARWKKKK